ncbi:MAG: sigma-70 family RNA polymerase sigma factor [Bacteroidales bacterium]|nr:sigma-70 family RNA polymerase sigma factor [Bacteroidales bacterium]
MDNKLLIQEVRNRNEKVISELYQEYRNQFMAFAYKKYNISTELAKEIYQESFLAFYKNVLNKKLVNLDVDFKTYLFQIGRNLINNEFRREKRIDSSIEIPNLKVVNDDNSEEDNEETMKKAIKESIQELNESCIKLLTMFYFEKRKYEEMMDLLDYKNIDSLKTQKYKCFKKLESIIKSNYKKEQFFN